MEPARRLYSTFSSAYLNICYSRFYTENTRRSSHTVVIEPEKKKIGSETSSEPMLHFKRSLGDRFEHADGADPFLANREHLVSLADLFVASCDVRSAVESAGTSFADVVHGGINGHFERVAVLGFDDHRADRCRTTDRSCPYDIGGLLPGDRSGGALLGVLSLLLHDLEGFDGVAHLAGRFIVALHKHDVGVVRKRRPFAAENR